MTVPAAHLAHLATAGVPDDELLRRFADHGDAAAFELLVWRYAGLVYGTARRALGRAADADDAFQAAFLALARKAGTVRRADSLGGWLHRVALRAALRLRADRARRTEREGAPLRDAPAREALFPDDTASVIDEELARLPEKLRVAFVLCELDGRTDADAAAHLGCPVGTVQSRLSRARERLRVRLSRRGFAPLALPLAPVVVPPALVSAAARDAVPFATGAAVEGAPAALARALVRSSALKPALGALALALLVAGAVFAARAREEDAPPAVPVRAEVAPPPRGVAPVPRVTFDAHKFVEFERVHFAPNGKWVAVDGLINKPGEDVREGRREQALVVWDATTGKVARAFTETDGLRGLGFAPDGSAFLTHHRAKESVFVWDTATWKKRYELAHDAPHGIAFSPDGKLLATYNPTIQQTPFGGLAGRAGAANVWDAATGKLAFRLAEGRSCLSVAFSPNGRAVLVALEARAAGESKGLDGKVLASWARAPAAVVALDVATREPLVETVLPGESYASIAHLSNGSFLAVNYHVAPGAALWDGSTGKKLRAFGDAKDAPEHAVASPDGKWVAAHGDGPRCWLWDAATGKKVSEFALPKGYSADQLRFSPDGAHWGVTGFNDDKGSYEREFLTVFHSVRTGKETARLPNVREVLFADRAAVLLAQSPASELVLEARPVADLFAPKS